MADLSPSSNHPGEVLAVMLLPDTLCGAKPELLHPSRNRKLPRQRNLLDRSPGAASFAIREADPLILHCQNLVIDFAGAARLLTDPAQRPHSIVTLISAFKSLPAYALSSAGFLR